MRFEILEGKKAVLQAATPPPDEVFVPAGHGIVRDILAKSKKTDEIKIRKLLHALGVKD